jgi:prophage regulatory protein
VAEQIREALKILRRKQVEARTGLSRSTIYQRIAEQNFPQSVTLGAGAKARAVGWIEAEIDAWLSAQIERSRKSA